jgi:hypothetical protein
MDIYAAGLSTSYFSAPMGTLDPELFHGDVIASWVRQDVQRLMLTQLSKYYRNPEDWAQAWLAGSGVSYQWSAARKPGDLDCLVGVNYVQFRKSNPGYAGLSDKEISSMINDEFREELQPKTADWNGYELTFFVNPGATDIRAINPYAAYDLLHDEWTVYPDKHAHAPENAAWDAVARSDKQSADRTSQRVTEALSALQGATSDAVRRNAQVKLDTALQQGSGLFDEIHLNRRLAFAHGGEGYTDFNNYRWQAAKRSGAIDVLRDLKNTADAARAASRKQTYGVDLPDADTLIRRAATSYSR